VFVVLSLYAGSRDGYLKFTRCDGYPFLKLGSLKRDSLETIIERVKALEKKMTKPFCWNLDQMSEL